MDDEQILFWYSGGASLREKPEKASNVVPYDKTLTWAENVARFQKATAEAKSGKDR